MTGKEVIKELLKLGWVVKGVKGSHHQMFNPATGQKVPVPVHGNRDLPTPTLNAILKQTGLK